MTVRWVRHGRRLRDLTPFALMRAADEGVDTWWSFSSDWWLFGIRVDWGSK